MDFDFETGEMIYAPYVSMSMHGRNVKLNRATYLGLIGDFLESREDGGVEFFSCYFERTDITGRIIRSIVLQLPRTSRFAKEISYLEGLEEKVWIN